MENNQALPDLDEEISEFLVDPEDQLDQEELSVEQEP